MSRWVETGAKLWLTLPPTFGGEDICHIQRWGLGGQVARLFRLHYAPGIKESVARVWVQEAAEVIVMSELLTQRQINELIQGKASSTQLSLF